MKRLILGSLVIWTTMATSAYSGEKQKITIKLWGEEFLGTETLNLKRLLKDENDGELKLGKYQVEEVQVFAKSEAGHGKLELLAEGHSTDRASVPGRSRDYDSDEKETYFKIKLDADSASVKEELKLKLKGHLRILKIILVLEKDVRGGGSHDGCIVQTGNICISDRDGERCVSVGNSEVCTGSDADGDRDDRHDRGGRGSSGSNQSTSQSTVCVNGRCETRTTICIDGKCRTTRD